MATLVLGTLGQAVGGPLGGLVGALAGRFIDQALFGPPTQKVEGPRLSDLAFMASVEGAGLPRVWGRMRVSPQVIWATRFKEVATTKTTGGKGGGPKVKTTTYSYFASFAIGLGEGPITGIGRVWADGKRLSLADYTHRLYLGDGAQAADPKIEAVEGADATSGFRDTAYLVFEEMPLEKFGNRPPQLTVEVIRRPPAAEPVLEELLTAVTLIPGTTEFGYATTQVSVVSGLNETVADNAHASPDVSDLVVALDQLEAEAPAVAHVSLVVAWHGTDLRAGNCEIRPKVERADRDTTPYQWRVGPVTRDTALVVSSYSGNPAAGGAPSDRSVYEAIVELKARGLAVTLYPFILMDIPAGNGLPDPYGGAEQAAYPWRGRITCHPAPGEPGSPDKTATAATQIAAFFGTAAASDFGWNGDGLYVTYSGPAEWGLRRQVLHLAAIADAAGGVDQFLIGSELVGITTVRSAASTYPAAGELAALAAEARTILGAGTRIGYAADWSEYHSHRPSDGSGDVHFHLDELWADAEIDFVGIDNYFPLADWRDGAGHLDALAGAPSVYDRDYLRSNVEGGEHYDWYYADAAARDAQNRTAITDGAYGKHWVFRQKDIHGWWANAHYDRPGGVQLGTPTAWTAQGKPVVFTELGCPAVDLGANQPNVFVDPKSSESFLPHYSSGRRDDEMQRAWIEAMLSYWHPAEGHNPVSAVYGDRMIDWERSAVWTWDARPWPEFPSLADVWADALNWRLGHWITGRLGLVPLADVVADMAGNSGVAIDASGLTGLVWGYAVDGLSSPRQMLDALMKAYFFDARERQGVIEFIHRGVAPVQTFARGDLVKGEGGRDFDLVRAQESELPRGLTLSFKAPETDYRQATARARRLAGGTAAEAEETLPLALPASRAQAIADAMLIERHVGRESAAFTLPPSALALDPGDVVTLDAGTRTFDVRVAEIGTGAGRRVRAVREDPSSYDQDDGPELARVAGTLKPPAPAIVHFLDLPVLKAEDAASAHAPRIAAYGAPWSPLEVWRAPTAAHDLALDAVVPTPAVIGVLAENLPAGPLWRTDEVSVLTVEVGSGVTLADASPAELFGGSNLAAVRTPSGRWELLQWQEATLVAPRTYDLTRLYRGLFGSEVDMGNPSLAGAAFVVIDQNVVATGLPATLALSPQYWTWGPQGRLPTDPLFASATLTFEAVGLRPYAPAYLEASRNPATGDVTLTWARRDRLAFDAWDQDVIPMSEAAESYRVQIMDGSTVKRAKTVTAPEYLYTAADQTADWGGLPASVTFRVRQRSAVVGSGAMAQKTETL
jgi:hypothetical protein